MSTDDAQTRAAATYNSAADTYDDPSNSFWAHFGRHTVERLDLRRGDNVLDVCCGSGASAIPAAAIVGEDGRVTGIDLAENLLDLARNKSAALHLNNTTFQTGDLLDLPFPDETFDAVVCVFGIFFVADMVAGIRELWRVVKPGGKLAITTWGPRFFEPASTAFWNSIQQVRADLYKGFNPWDRITEPDSLRQLFSESGIDEAMIEAASDVHQIDSADGWWSAVLGSGYRGTVDQLTEDECESVCSANADYIRTSGIHWVEANVVYAVAVKADRTDT